MRPDIDEIKARCEAATPGPWEAIVGWATGGINRISSPDNDMVVSASRFGHNSLDISDYDRDFISNAREDIPALLAYIEELEAKIAEFTTLSSGFQKPPRLCAECGAQLHICAENTGDGWLFFFDCPDHHDSAESDDLVIVDTDWLPFGKIVSGKQLSEIGVDVL